MPRIAKLVLTGLLCLEIRPLLHAQGVVDSTAGSVGFRGGISLPLGDWAKSRINPGVSLFTRSMTFGGDLEVRIGRRWSLAVDGEYTVLNGSDWEEYAAGKGDKLTVSAYAIRLAVLVRPHILSTEKDFLRIELGPALLLTSGGETYRLRKYNYDFLSETAFGAQGGIEYTRMLTYFLGVSLHAAVIVFPSAVEYVDKDTRSVLSLPVTLGARFYF